jgi:hypothetical protein
MEFSYVKYLNIAVFPPPEVTLMGGRRITAVLGAYYVGLNLLVPI